MIVREALVADPLVLQGDAPARAAAAVLVKPHVTSVLVADGDRLLGSVTEEAIVAAVAQDDIADAATAVLLDPAAHAGRTYALTGPEAITMAEVAAVLASATGREISYLPETLAEAYASRKVFEAPEWEVDASGAVMSPTSTVRGWSSMPVLVP